MTSQTQNLRQDRRLAAILKLDAALCAACALPALAVPGWLAGFLLPETPALSGFPIATVVMETGILLALSAAGLLFIATRPAVSRPLAWFSAGVDTALVVGTMLLLALAGGAFSLDGILALLVIAAATGLIAALKLRALRRAPAMTAAA